MTKYLCSLFAMGSLSAEMVFESKLIEVKVGVDDQTVTVDFPFEIKGQDTEIKTYDAPCSCLEALIPLNNDRSPKLAWKVGETGKIRGKFLLGNFKGTVEKQIVIHFLGEEEPTKLTVRASIPELVKIEPPTHQWSVGGGLESKTFKITMNHTEPIRILEDSGTSKDFPYELKTIKEGLEYEVVVTPTQDKTPAMGMIRIRTDCKSKRFERMQFFAVMRTPRPAGTKASP